MRCVIIAGSPDTDIHFIKSTVQTDDYVICADKGYSYAKAAGILPDMIVGDFDSCADQLPQNCEIVRLNVKKDDTDTAVCVNYALERGYDELVIMGATGGRLDHSYANLCLLEYISSCGAAGELLSEHEKIMILQNGEYLFHQHLGKTFSVFPFGCERAVATIQGAEYPVERFVFESRITRGLSNIFAEQSRITVHDGKLLLIINLKKV